MCKYLVLLLCCALNFTYADECKKIGDCSCEYYDGTGVNLSPIIGRGSLPLHANDANGVVYFFSPCEDQIYIPDNHTNTTVVENNPCSKGYTLCRVTQNNTTFNYTRLGELKETQFTNGKDGDGLYLTYVKPNQSTTHVKLVCSSDKKSYFFPGAPDNGTTNLLLFSPHACPVTVEDFSKPSTGTVLLIMLFVTFLSYFIIGATVNAIYLGARGMEIVPHVDFWRDLPSLVRDGAVYLQNGCRVTSQAPNTDSYDAI